MSSEPDMMSELILHSIRAGFGMIKIYTKATYGLVQNVCGFSGSRTETCPDMPSVYPLRANTRKAPAMCSSMKCRCFSMEPKIGMLGNRTPCEIACKADFSGFSALARSDERDS